MTSIRRQYCDTRFGQVHVRVLEANGPEDSAPLVMLHPAPSSGLYFATVMPLLNRGRRVIAPDYPGYGGSDPASGEPDIVDYAGAVLDVVGELKLGMPVDVLGFHTGCLVAAEMAIAEPESIRRLVLCDIPYFTGELQNGLRSKMSKPMKVTAKLDSLADAWRFNIESRVPYVPLERAQELIAEHVRAGTRDSLGFRAAFSYDCEKRFKALQADTVILATQSGLHAPTLEAAKSIADATLVDVKEVKSAVFETGAAAISKRIAAALER